MHLLRIINNLFNDNNFLLSYYFFTYLLSCSSIILSLMYFLTKKNKESLLYTITISSYTLAILVAFMDFFFFNIINNYTNALIIISILIRTFFICISVFTLPSFFSYYLTGMQKKFDKIVLIFISFSAFFIEIIILVFDKIKTIENLKTYYYNVIGFVIVATYIYTLFIILKNRKKIDTENKKFLVNGAKWWGILCIPVMIIQYLRPVFKIPYYIYFEPILFFFWNVYFFAYFVKFYYLHIGEKTLSMIEFCQKFNISNKEKEIILCILKGFLNKEIAGTLDITETTVKKHIYNIFKKINVSSRVDLVNLIKK